MIITTSRMQEGGSEWDVVFQLFCTEAEIFGLSRRAGPANFLRPIVAMQSFDDGPLETQAYVVPSKGAKLVLRDIVLPPLMRSQVLTLNTIVSIIAMY